MNNILYDIIKKEVICYKTEKNNFFFTEKDTNWIFDFRRVFLQGKLLEQFSSFFWDKYEENFPFQIGGLELGAVPLIGGIILEGVKRGKYINGFVVRKDRKTTGLGNIIEGEVNNEKIIIIDDLFNSGKSIGKVYDSVKDINNNIFRIFTFVNFGNNKGKDFLNRNNLLLDYEFTLSDFGLDIFGNSLTIKKEHFAAPIIFPKSEKIIGLNNPNKYIFTIKSAPIKDGKNIYMSGEGGSFLSICSDTGNINWQFDIDPVKGHKNILSSPLLIDDYIIFGSYDGNLYCLYKDTGKVRWVNTNADWIGSSPIYSKKDKLVYVGLELGGLENKGSLSAFDLNSGEEKWRVLFDDYVHCSPGYSEQLGLVVCGSNDGKFVCVDSNDGSNRFYLSFNEPNKGGFAFSDDGKKVFFGCFDKNFYCINLENKEIEWNLQTENIIYTKPILIGDNIFFGGLDKFFYHLDINGIIKGKVRTLGKIFGECIFLKKGIIAFGSNDSYIYIYDYINLRTLFVIEHKEKISTKLIFDDKMGVLYVNNFMNELYKYNISTYL